MTARKDRSNSPMELLVARNVSASHRGERLLCGVDLTLSSGRRLGLVGANGSGKSTLLRLLAGLDVPDEGRVRRAPGVRVGYLGQEPGWDEARSGWQTALSGLAHVSELERELRAEERLLSRGEGSMERYGALHELFERAGGYGSEVALRETLSLLGLDDELLSLPVSRLSGGERARLGLAKVLAGDPELLLLDEPSNHLDLPARRWLGERLRRHRGALALVSHDRALLDEVCTDTGELAGGRLALTRGGLSLLREQQGVEQRGQERKRRERRKQIERLERTAAELRTWGTVKAQRRRKRLERQLTEQCRQATPEAREAATPHLEAREAHGLLLEARDLSKVEGARTLLTGAHLRLEAGEKVALLGPNGSGKSTLLRLLAGELASDDPRSRMHWHRDAKVFHSDQLLRGLDPEKTVAANLASLVSPERVNMLLTLCGLDRERGEELPVSLSSGERARAGLTKLLGTQANVLLLDEPSNDLDLQAIETLHGALESTDAALVLATHDRALATVASRVWSIEDGELVEYRGGVEGYLAGRRRQEPGLAPSPLVNEDVPQANDTSTPSVAPQPADSGAPSRETGEHEAEQERLELERLELERLGIEARLADPLLLGERGRQRLEQKLALVFDELSLRYDRRLEPPGATVKVRESRLELAADLVADGSLRFEGDGGARLGLIVRDAVAHLIVKEQENACLLPWARSELLDCAVRLTFYLLAPLVVQHHSRVSLDTRLLRDRGQGWWTIDRRRFEELEGWGLPRLCDSLPGDEGVETTAAGSR